jgi:hypothetical protein
VRFRLPTAGNGISPAILFPSSDGVERPAAGLLQEAGGMASTPESSEESRGSAILRRPHHVPLSRPPNGLARTVQSRGGDEVLMPAVATAVTAGAHRLRHPSNAPPPQSA